MIGGSLSKECSTKFDSGPETMTSVSLSATNAGEKPRRDRLTSLDENLLGSILSCLPSADVVRTRILSKDWRHKWTLSNSVDTDLSDWGRPGDRTSGRQDTFIDFLDKMLRAYDHLRCFRATFRRYMPGWIDAVLTHKNLECLDVNFNNNDYAFPCSLLNSVSLRELKVVQPVDSLPVTVPVAEKNNAPRLTSLSLYNVAFVKDNFESGIASFEFPALEKLELRMTSYGYQESRKLESVEIYAPLLTSFSFEAPDGYRGHRVLTFTITIKIAAPRLNRLSCYNVLPDSIVFDRSLIVSAFLSTWSFDSLSKITGEEATNLFNRLINLEELILSSSMAEVLTNGPPLHQNDKLKRLTLTHRSNANQLLKLLHLLPSLEFVSVNVEKWKEYDYGATDIPSCFAFRMEEVVLQAFSGEVPQYHLAEFFLKAAMKLKKLTITTSQVDRSEEMKKILSAFNLWSPSLEICSRLPDIEYDYTHIRGETWSNLRKRVIGRLSA